jgi:hypothetical protein
MILESTQLLWTAWLIATEGTADRALLEAAPRCRSTGKPGYRPTHKNHPCAIWTRASIANYRWLIALARALVAEYHIRWPVHACKRSERACDCRKHACEPHLDWLAANEPPLPQKPLTWPALAMPDEYKISQSPTACYKAFYVGSKGARGLLTYTRRERPLWTHRV